MDFSNARRHMIDSQILPNKVTDVRIIDAMSTVPREIFVPDIYQGTSYVDEALRIVEGRYIMEPMIVAKLLQHAEPKEEDLALIIGCGTGYTAAILSSLVATIIVVESNALLVEKATDVLLDLKIDNVAIIEGELCKGCVKQGPYNVIIFDGSIPQVPQPIIDQLEEGGRLVAVVNPESERELGNGIVMTRFHNAISSIEQFQAGTPMLPGFDTDTSFIF
mgnify:CR=1 FL=1